MRPPDLTLAVVAVKDLRPEEFPEVSARYGFETGTDWERAPQDANKPCFFGWFKPLGSDLRTSLENRGWKWDAELQRALREVLRLSGETPTLPGGEFGVLLLASQAGSRAIEEVTG